MKTSIYVPVAGALLAIAITTTMDATGLSAFSALPLLAVTAVFWSLQRLPRAQVGLQPGEPVDYGLALLHAAAVIGALTAIVFALRLAHPGSVDWSRVASRVALNSTVGALVVLLTEEGFFRGWLWGSLQAAGLDERRTLLWSSLAFAAWHISAVTLETGFNPPMRQVPVFLVNAFAMGLVWGELRSISGSVIVSSLAHSFWNAVAYRLYGFGTKVGALGIHDTTWFAPEVGVVGLVLNLIFARVLYALMKDRLKPVLH